VTDNRKTLKEVIGLDGKILVSIRLDLSVRKEIKILAAKLETTMGEIMAQAIIALREKLGESPL
jgi:hypothetical protein